MVRFVKNRIEEIMQEVNFKGKSVLEIGCVGLGEDDKIGGENWIHGRISKVSKKVLGIDIDKKGIDKLKKKGYNVKYQNVEEKFNLDKKYDIIICAKTLEHLQNLGLFLDNVKNHLKRDGIFIIITPNAHSISFFMQLLIKGKVCISNEHVHWHNENTLRNLLGKLGFKVIKISYSHPRPLFNKFRGYVSQLFWILFPERFGRQIFCISQVIK